MSHVPAVTVAPLASAAFAVAAEPVPGPVMPGRHGAVLRDHCLKCHNEKTRKGQVRLDDLPFAITSVETAARWQKVLDALNSNERRQHRRPQGGPRMNRSLLAFAGVAVLTAFGAAAAAGVDVHEDRPHRDGRERQRPGGPVVRGHRTAE